MKLRKMHGPNADLRKRILDKASLWIIGIAIVIAIVGFALFGNQLRQNGQQNQTIISQQAQIIHLQKQHSTDITSTAALVKELKTAGQQQLIAFAWIVQVNNSTCQALTQLTQTTCPSLPNIPGVQLPTVVGH